MEDTIAILRGLESRYEVFHGVKITDNAIIAAATLSNRYITDRFLPDKAIDLIDEACAMIRTEMDSMPTELDVINRKIIQMEIEEAALVDGATEFQLFSRIYVPMSTASIATVTLFYAISRWNGYYWSRMLLADPNQQPLQVYLRQLIENYQKLYDESPVVLSYSADSLAYAIIVCSIIPVLVIYPYIQKYFAKGVNVGGVKG